VFATPYMRHLEAALLSENKVKPGETITRTRIRGMLEAGREFVIQTAAQVAENLITKP
jgi:hypothetical protein